MQEEFLDVLDGKGEKTGEQKLRSEVHGDGDWHRVAHVWVLNSRDELLLQRRTKSKLTHPGMLDVSCAGHLQAGDDAKAGAIRELAEELGIQALEDDLQFLATIQRSGRTDTGVIDNQFIDIFLLRTDKELEDFVLQAEEVSEVMFVSLPELKRMCAEKQPDLVDRGEEYELLFAKLSEK